MTESLHKNRPGDQADAVPADPLVTHPAQDLVDKQDGVSNTEMNAETENYPHGIKLVLILSSVLLAVFLVSLDRTILATAIPKISDDFHALNDIGWYASAYMLTNASVQLGFGRIYKCYPTKWVFFVSVLLFEIGSAICGAAPTSTVLIIGRAIAGLGSAGIFSGALLIITFTVPLHRRPLIMGLFGGIFGISSVAGPLLGGAFTDSKSLTWRWCFYINLPFGGVTLLVIYFLLNIEDPAERGLPFREQLRRLDLLGTSFIMPCMVCLILALQWGGTTYPWSNWRIILLLVLAGVLGIAFITVQVIKGEDATIPPRVIKNRSVWSGAWLMFFIMSSSQIFIYYLPIWFQAIKGTSAVESGIRTLPLLLGMVVTSILGGGLTVRIGYYVPNMIFGSILTSIGTGLLTTLKVNSSSGEWIGYQALFGLGIGLVMQAPSLAIQSVLEKADVSIGLAILIFSQQLGGAIFVAVAETIFTNALETKLSSIPGLDDSVVINTGATALQSIVPTQYLSQVLSDYNWAIIQCFYAGTALGVLCFFFTLPMEWKNIKPKPANSPKKVEEAEKSEESEKS